MTTYAQDTVSQISSFKQENLKKKKKERNTKKKLLSVNHKILNYTLSLLPS